MCEDTVYRDDINALLKGSVTILSIGMDLKNSEDLAGDIMNFLLEIERFPDWAEISCLADLAVTHKCKEKNSQHNK